MDLIERYVQEVARRLPRKQRDDVARELRSSLEDALEDRAGAPLDRVDEQQAVELLLDFGPPARVAASYRPGTSYLVGPALYPSFIATMKICLAIIGGLIVFGASLAMMGRPATMQDLGGILLQAVSDIQSAFISLLGIVVLIFAIIERVGSPVRRREEEWDPRDLPAVGEDRDRVDLTRELIGIVLATVGLLLINFMPNWLQAHVRVNETSYNFLLIGPRFLVHLTLLNVYLLLSVALGAFVLWQGRWHAATRAADLAVSLLLVVFFWRLWQAAPTLLPDLPTLLESGWPTDQAADFAELSVEVLAPLLWWAFLAALLAAIWGSIRKLIRLSRSVFGQRPVPVS
jgi:hypothetical protein